MSFSGAQSMAKAGMSLAPGIEVWSRPGRYQDGSWFTWATIVTRSPL